MDTKTRHIISRLKETAGKILPASAKLWLYGSRARGDAKEDSDWDLLIILEKSKIDRSDFDRYIFPFHMLGAELQEVFNPILYTSEEWNRFLSTPFRQNVITDKIALQ